MGQISDILEWLSDARFFTSFRMTVENCILVVYRLASHAISCYGARSFNLLASNPSGAAKIFSENFGPERAIKSDKKEDFMRIEGPMSARVKDLRQMFAPTSLRARLRRAWQSQGQIKIPQIISPAYLFISESQFSFSGLVSHLSRAILPCHTQNLLKDLTTMVH